MKNFALSVAVVLVVLWAFRWFEKPTSPLQADVKIGENISIDKILKRIVDNDCHRILIVPVVLDEILDPSEKIKLGGPDYGSISGGDLKEFYFFVGEKVPSQELELGDQYQLIFLMNKAPTTDETILTLRKSGGVWCLVTVSERYVLNEEFSKWIASRMRRFEK